MWMKTIVGLSVYQILIVALSQAQAISDDVFRLLEQYPPLAILVIVVYYLQKVQRDDIKERQQQQKEENLETRDWLEKQLEIQRVSLKEIYEGQQQFFSTLLTEIQKEQDKMSDEINKMHDQLAINTATVSEIAKIDSMFSELIARLEKK